MGSAPGEKERFEVQCSGDDHDVNDVNHNNENDHDHNDNEGGDADGDGDVAGVN